MTNTLTMPRPAAVIHILTPAAALMAALKTAGVRPEELTTSSVRYAAPLYELSFSTDFLHYDLYVDETTGEVPGISCAPVEF